MRVTFVVETLFVTTVSLVRLLKHETRDVKTAEHTMLLTRKSWEFSTFDGDLLWVGIGLWQGFQGRCDSGTRVIHNQHEASLTRV